MQNKEHSRGTRNESGGYPQYSSSKPPERYPINLLVQYTNDKEYRQCLREVCQMQSLHLTHYDVDPDNDIDDVTRDEWDYDSDAMSELLDHVYATTHFHPRFQSLYLSAAGTMFSEDMQIGITVLFSYDYFQAFHACLCTYYTLDVKHPSNLFELRMNELQQRFEKKINR